MDAKMKSIFETRQQAVRDCESGKITPSQYYKILRETWAEMDFFDKALDYSECRRQLGFDGVI